MRHEMRTQIGSTTVHASDGDLDLTTPLAPNAYHRRLMKIQDTLTELEAVADRKGIRVTYEALGGEVGSGGLCKVRGVYRIIVDKRASPGERVTVLAQALGLLPLDDIFVAPEVHDTIERASAFKGK